MLVRLLATLALAFTPTDAAQLLEEARSLASSDPELALAAYDAARMTAIDEAAPEVEFTSFVETIELAARTGRPERAGTTADEFVARFNTGALGPFQNRTLEGNGRTPRSPRECRPSGST